MMATLRLSKTIIAGILVSVDLLWAIVMTQKMEKEPLGASPKMWHALDALMNTEEALKVIKSAVTHASYIKTILFV